MSRRKLRAALAAAAVTGLVVAGTAAPALAAAAMTLSNPTGPSGGGNTIIGTVPAGTFPAGTSPVVQFQFGSSTSTACNTTAKAVAQIVANGATTTAGVLTVDPATVRPISTSKIAFQVPSAVYPLTNIDGTASTINTTGLVLVGTQTLAKWNVCVYDSDSTTGSNLLATGSYTLAAKPTITSIVPTPGRRPGRGWADDHDQRHRLQYARPDDHGFDRRGGAHQRQAVHDRHQPDRDHRGARAGHRIRVTVVAPGGTVSSLDPDNNPVTGDTPIPFTYSNAITVPPNTGAAGAVVNLDISGAATTPHSPTENGLRWARAKAGSSSFPRAGRPYGRRPPSSPTGDSGRSCRCR